MYGYLTTSYRLYGKPCVLVFDYECVASPFILGKLTTFIKNFSPREANQKTRSGESSQESCCINNEVSTAVVIIKTKENEEEKLSRLKRESVNVKSHKMVYDDNDILDNPQRRYVKLRKEFDKKYLNLEALDYEFDNEEIAKAYHDFLEFLEETVYKDIGNYVNDDAKKSTVVKKHRRIKKKMKS